MGQDALELDLLGARAWPSVETTSLGDWRLRFANGVTKRANSVLPLGPDDASVGGAPSARDRCLYGHGFRTRQ
jgi:hypothetical protein